MFASIFQVQFNLVTWRVLRQLSSWHVENLTLSLNYGLVSDEEKKIKAPETPNTTKSYKQLNAHNLKIRLDEKYFYLFYIERFLF